jgi:hypothetical protein
MSRGDGFCSDPANCPLCRPLVTTSACGRPKVADSEEFELHKFLERERASLAAFERAWERQWSRDCYAASARGAARPASKASVGEWRARYLRYLSGL